MLEASGDSKKAGRTLRRLGDTVYLAARFVIIGEPGRILVCPRCHELLAHAFAFDGRGTIDIKGVGPVATSFLAAPKRALST